MTKQKSADIDEMMVPANINQALSWYLMSCYLYYSKNEPVLVDTEYDSLCNYILENWGELKKSNHPHKRRVTKQGLTTSGFKVRIPKIAKMASREWKRD